MAPPQWLFFHTVNERKLSRALGKQVNRSLILNLIKDGPVARSAIAERSGLSPASVSNLTAELIDEGWVLESGVLEGARGRPPTMLELNSHAGHVVGVKVMPDALVGVVTDLEAAVVAQRAVGFADASDAGVDEIVDRIAALVTQVAEDAEVARDDLLGVGVGLAGIVDGYTGVCRYSPFFGWRDVNLAAPLAARLDLDVYLENDVNSLTIAEQWFGHGRGYDHFAVVTVGRGVGVGFVLNGRFYGGGDGGVGELGHVTVHPQGPACTCGRRGCLEAMTSDRALVGAARRAVDAGETTSLDPNTLDVASIVSAADDGDPLARRLLADSGRWLGTGLAMVVNLLNPQLVIVAGEGVDAGRWRLDPMREAFDEGLFDTVGSGTRLVIESAGDVTWARGAACVVLSEFFKSPLHRVRPPVTLGVGAR